MPGFQCGTPPEPSRSCRGIVVCYVALKTDNVVGYLFRPASSWIERGILLAVVVAMQRLRHVPATQVASG